MARRSRRRTFFSVDRDAPSADGSRRLRYGSSRHQRLDLRAPRRGAAGRPGTVVMLHGGFWRWPYGRAITRPLVEDLRRTGWWVADVEYRRLGCFGGGGGFPNTFDDVAMAIRATARLRPGPIAVVGHSAGAHLALCTAARVADEVDLTTIIGIGAVTDLRRLSRTGHTGAIELATRAPAATRWSSVSPIHMLPIGVPLSLIHSRRDTTVAITEVEDFAVAASGAGDDVDLVIVDDDSHIDALRPSSTTWRVAMAALGSQLAQTQDRLPSGAEGKGSHHG